MTGSKKRVEARTAELTETVQTLRFTQFSVDRSSDRAFLVDERRPVFYVNDAACDYWGTHRMNCDHVGTGYQSHMHPRKSLPPIGVRCWRMERIPSKPAIGPGTAAFFRWKSTAIC